MKTVNTYEYISLLRELTEQGKEVNVRISGNSMSPFLKHQRDVIVFKKPERELRKGDMVFYQRENGQFVMHRIWRVKSNGYYIVGDAQVAVEGPISREQIFAVVIKAERKGKWIAPGDFWWEFFEHIWIRMVPYRKFVFKVYGILKKLKKG